MDGVGCRPPAVAVAAKVRTHHGEPLGQRRGDPVPAGVRLGVPVEEEHGRTLASDDGVDLGLARLDPLRTEPGEERGVG
jgi:hypothetical protein